jgi:hypothetical protein
MRYLFGAVLRDGEKGKPEGARGRRPGKRGAIHAGAYRRGSSPGMEVRASELREVGGGVRLAGLSKDVGATQEF